MKTKYGEIVSVTVLGRRWFQKTYGNTYHTAQVLVNGEYVWKSGKTYGYGDHYVQTAEAWLHAHGYMPRRKKSRTGPGEPAWQYYRERHGVAWTTQVVDVAREKDL